MTDNFDVVVLGTGLFGAALSYHLAREPSLRVAAFDAHREPGQPSATAASAGILSVQGWDPWDLAIVRESAEEYRGLAEEEGVEPLRKNGGLRVARTEDGERWLDRVRRVLEREGTEAQRVGAGELRELLPFADLEDVRVGLYTPDDATMDPTALQAAYLRAATRFGADLRPGAGEVALEVLSGGRWRIGGGDEPVVADSLVVAAGAWSKELLARLGHPLPLAPFRAQAVLLRPRPLIAPFPTLNDLDLNLYVRPASRGRLLAGDGTGSHEANPSRWDPNADGTFVDAMRRDVGGLFYGFPPEPVEAAWAGLCVASPDRFPLVGRVPGGEGLYLATGFNGFGTMRAGGLARRLAEAIRSDRWEPLRPADPCRLPTSWAPFDPLPEFPLESEDEGAGPAWDATAPTRASPPARAPPDGIHHRRLAGVKEVAALRWASLSEWFDPLLGLFAKDALRTGGSVEVAEEDGRVRGLFLYGSSEGVGSGFTRTRRVAERYLERMEPSGIYMEDPWRPGGETVEIFAADLRDWESKERVRNPVRIARPGDLPRIGGLMRGELGPGVDTWLATLPRPEETAFLCEIDGRVVGVSWLSRVGPFARGHSFLVHPRFRGLGIGTDLLNARMLWLRRTGGRQVVSEIYDGNVASRTAAERAGMAFVGRMYHFRPLKGA